MKAAARWAIGPWWRLRIALDSAPVLMPTGHAVSHSPQAAQVSMLTSRKARSSARRPCAGSALSASRASSRAPTMRWRGVTVSPRVGHRGSQKPHSMQRSINGSAAAIGLMFLR